MAYRRCIYNCCSYEHSRQGLWPQGVCVSRIDRSSTCLHCKKQRLHLHNFTKKKLSFYLVDKYPGLVYVTFANIYIFKTMKTSISFQRHSILSASKAFSRNFQEKRAKLFGLFFILEVYDAIESMQIPADMDEASLQGQTMY